MEKKWGYYPHLTANNLNVELEVDHITVFNDVFLAFHSEFPGFFYLGFRAKSKEVVTVIDFGLNKPTLKVRVNHPGGLRSFGAFWESPGANFFNTCGEVSAHIEHIVAGLNHFRKT